MFSISALSWRDIPLASKPMTGTLTYHLSRLGKTALITSYNDLISAAASQSAYLDGTGIGNSSVRVVEVLRQKDIS